MSGQACTAEIDGSSRCRTHFFESSSKPSGPTRCRPTLTAAQVRATLPAAVGTRSWVASWQVWRAGGLPQVAAACIASATQLTRILWYLWVHLQQQVVRPRGGGAREKAKRVWRRRRGWSTTGYPHDRA